MRFYIEKVVYKSFDIYGDTLYKINLFAKYSQDSKKVF
jgi:hypothetical protein